MTHWLDRITAIFMLMLALAWPAYAVAQPSLIEPRTNNIEAVLLAERPTAVAGDEVMLAIRFRPKDNWHGYWENPGDAGFGLGLDWQLPAGFEADKPRYPVPSRLLINGLMNHVYKGEHAVLIPLTLPDSALSGPQLLRVQARWLACTDEVCVPEQADLSTSVTVAEQRVAGADSADFARWRGALAAPLDSAGRFELAGDKLRIAVPWPANAALTAPYFFLREDGLIDYAAPQEVRRAGDELRITLRLRNNPRKAPAALSGLLATGVDDAGQPTGLDIRLDPGAVAQGGKLVENKQIQQDSAPSFWLILLGAVAGGLLLNVMPCVFPILSLKALTLARAGGDAASARREALAYSAGVMVSCLALGAVMLGFRAAGAQIGWAFQLQQPSVVIALTLLMFAITANLAGWFELPAPTHGGRSSGGFATGVLAAVVATPCSGPFMAAAIGAALLLPTALALLIFAGLGLGLALPFLALGFIPALRIRLPKPGPWMNRLRRWLAIPMAVTALALLWLLWRMGGVPMLLIGLVGGGLLSGLLARIGRRQREGRSSGAFALALAAVSAIVISAGHMADRSAPSSTVTAGLPGAEPFSAARLAALRADNRPVFLYFTADWCITCKANEASSINRAETARAFKSGNVAVMVGDWTRNDPAITQFLQAQGVAGVPLYLWYAPGAGKPERLPQLLTPSMLSDRANQ